MMETIGKITMNGEISVGVFEKMLEDRFGLFIQVYRKSYGTWLQTWATDMWTLDEQNNRGKILGEKIRRSFR